MGRRGRRELRAPRDARLRARLRHARRDPPGRRDGERMPQRPDRSAQRLPGLRRSGLRTRGLQRAAPVGPIASPSARAARSPTRSHRATSRPRSPPGCSTGGAPAMACTSTCRRSSPAIWSLAPWLLDYAVDGVIRLRTGNRRAGAVPHGAFPCVDENGVGDRWVAIACYDDADWTRSRDHRHRRPGARTAPPARPRTRSKRWWARGRRPEPAARSRRAAGGRAGSGAGRRLRRPPRGSPTRARAVTSRPTSIRSSACGLYERNGFRLSGSESGYDRAGPTLGQDTDWVLGDLLGLDPDAIGALRTSGAVEMARARRRVRRRVRPAARARRPPCGSRRRPSAGCSRRARSPSSRR